MPERTGSEIKRLRRRQEIPHENLESVLAVLPEPTRVIIKVVGTAQADIFRNALESLSERIGLQGKATFDPNQSDGFELEGGTKADVLKLIKEARERTNRIKDEMDRYNSERDPSKREQLEKESRELDDQVHAHFQKAVWMLEEGVIELTSTAINIEYHGEEPALVARVRNASSGVLQSETQIQIKV